VLDAIELERMGIPTLTIVGEKFARAAAVHARVGGLPLLPLLVEPPPATTGFDPAMFVQEHLANIRAAFLEPIISP
jgi:hypothetical protein